MTDGIVGLDRDDSYQPHHAEVIMSGVASAVIWSILGGEIALLVAAVVIVVWCIFTEPTDP